MKAGDGDFLTLEQGRAVVHCFAHAHKRRVDWGVYENPGHPLHGRPTNRRETGLLEVVCQHGVGHPIDGSIEWMDAFGAPGNRGTWGIHGCDGCCL